MESIRLLEDDRARAEQLLFELDLLLKQQGLTLKDADGLAVSIGPGSFTGLRISVTMAKTLSQFTGLPLYGISSLQAWAASLDTLPSPKTLLVPLIDARANRIFSAAYTLGSAFAAGEDPGHGPAPLPADGTEGLSHDPASPHTWEDDGPSHNPALLYTGEDEGPSHDPTVEASGAKEAFLPHLLIPEKLYLEEDFLSLLRDCLAKGDFQEVLFIGPAFSLHPALEEKADFPYRATDPKENPSPLPGICRLAALKAERGERDSCLDLKPNYLRRSQAELTLAAKEERRKKDEANNG